MAREQGVLRLRFTHEDLLRTRVLPTPDPMWELVLSMHALIPHGELNGHTTWRRGARNRINGSDLEADRKLLAVLVPPAGNFADFLTPSVAADIATSLDLVRATPKSQLRADLDAVRLRRPDTSFGRGLADGDVESMSLLIRSMRRYFDAVVAPFWPDVVRHVRADQGMRANQLLTCGLAGVLTRLGPSIRWQWPDLEAPYPRDHTIMLGGRGLTLIPSYFCTGAVTLIDPERTPVLVYPACRLPGDPAELDRAVARLSPVVGTSRARILVTLRAAHSTSELAESIGLSLASASRQVTLLREAGLVTSARAGQSVVHTLTAKGRRLLEGY